MLLDFFTGGVLGLLILWLSITNSLKIRQFNTANALSTIYFITFIGFALIEVGFFAQKLNFLEFIRYKKMSIVVLQALILSGVGILSVTHLNSKKIKTIWRIPLIGILLSYFSLEFLQPIQLGFSLVTFFVFWINRTKLRILLANLIVHLLLSISLYFLTPDNFWVLNLLLAIYLLNMKGIWDMVRIKQMMIDQDGAK